MPLAAHARLIMWSAATGRRSLAPRLVGSIRSRDCQPRGDKSPLIRALTSQRTSHKNCISPHPQPFSQREKGEMLLLPSDACQVVRVQFKGRHFCFFISHAVALHLLLSFEHTVIVVRDNTEEFAQPFIP